MRREFEDCLNALNRKSLPGVPAVDRLELVPQFADPIFGVVQRWIDAYMHTGRVGSVAIFEFRPTAAELAQLLAAVPMGAAIESIADVVFHWLFEKLDGYLAVANSRIEDDLVPDLQSAVERTVSDLQGVSRVDSECVRRLGKIVESTILAKARELHEWFESRPDIRTATINYDGIAAVVEERFKITSASRRLVIYHGDHDIFYSEVEEQNVKQVFDLWSELIFNAIKYSYTPTTRVRVWPLELNGCPGLVFSSYRTESDVGEDWIQGDPRSSVDDAQFRDRKSGLTKVASLAASLARDQVILRVVRRRRSFHVIVPLRVQ
jgi:hypothetical protein